MDKVITQNMLFYQTNKDWYYFDPRYMRDRLTDKATKKAVDSYVKCHTFEFGEENAIIDRTIKDIEDYTKNKSSYKFIVNDEGSYQLSTINNKPIEPLSKAFQ